MPVLYYKEDYAKLEIDLEGDYVLRVVGVGPGRTDFVVTLDDEELDRYREWGEHFVVTMAHRIHRDPDAYADRNRLSVPVAREASKSARPARRFPIWIVGSAAVAGVIAAYMLLVYSAIGRPAGDGEPVVGMAVGLHSAPDDIGEIHFMAVRLADGSTVQVRLPKKGDYKENAAVLLRGSKSSLFGSTSYRFERFR